MSRPAAAEERLALTERGDGHFKLETPYRDGTTYVVLEPLDFVARLAALVPPPGTAISDPSTVEKTDSPR